MVASAALLRTGEQVRIVCSRRKRINVDSVARAGLPWRNWSRVGWGVTTWNNRPTGRTPPAPKPFLKTVSQNPAGLGAAYRPLDDEVLHCRSSQWCQHILTLGGDTTRSLRRTSLRPFCPLVLDLYCSTCHSCSEKTLTLGSFDCLDPELDFFCTRRHFTFCADLVLLTPGTACQHHNSSRLFGLVTVLPRLAGLVTCLYLQTCQTCLVLLPFDLAKFVTFLATSRLATRWTRFQSQDKQYPLLIAGLERSKRSEANRKVSEARVGLGISHHSSESQKPPTAPRQYWGGHC
jgi:hypothetical protein